MSLPKGIGTKLGEAVSRVAHVNKIAKDTPTPIKKEMRCLPIENIIAIAVPRIYGQGNFHAFL